MPVTGLTSFDDTIHKTNTWLHEITSRLGWDDRHKGLRALRISLHLMRDRMPVPATAKLSAQLPMLMRGLYYEGWQPARTPTDARSIDDFLSELRDAFADESDFDAEAVFREIVSVMRLHVTAGEIEDVRNLMPREIRTLWDEEPMQ